MPRNLLTIVVFLLAIQPLNISADPAAFLGIGYTFGGNFAVTAKVLSSDKEDNGVLAVGASWYPFAANTYGMDISAGYAADNSAILAGWDFLQQKGQVSAGWADTEDDRDTPVAPVVTPSDKRLKKDIQYLTTLSNGIKLYSFKYISEDNAYVGVMAQDLLEDKSYRDAVVTNEFGFYAIKYDLLGLKMVTLEEWKLNPNAIFINYVKASF
jgi:hypothetical protein